MLTRFIYNFLGSIYGRLLLHLLFWCVVAAFLLMLFGHFRPDYGYTFLFVALLLPIAIATTYIINYFLIPHYLLQKRYFRFCAYFLFTLVFSVWGEMLLIVWAFVKLADYQYSNMHPHTDDIFFLGVVLYFIVFFSTSVNLLKHWVNSQQHISKLRSQQLEAQLKLKEAELQLLKGQIHPHFLFNTLNNLYGLALERSEHMPDAILRLSRLLDVLLYRSHAPQIALSAELKLIEDYVKLEELRFEERLEISWLVEGETEGWAVAPFLLFPFLENAFKHGFAGETEKLLLQLKVSVAEGMLYFRVLNSVNKQHEAPAALPGGIGLKNVQKRLALLYPDKHRLLINPMAESYEVQLQLALTPLSTHEIYATS